MRTALLPLAGALLLSGCFGGDQLGSKGYRHLAAPPRVVPEATPPPRTYEFEPVTATLSLLPADPLEDCVDCDPTSSIRRRPLETAPSSAVTQVESFLFR
jgi:hypothetical protein